MYMPSGSTPQCRSSSTAGTKRPSRLCSIGSPMRGTSICRRIGARSPGGSFGSATVTASHGNSVWLSSSDHSLLFQRDGQVRLDDGCDIPRPDHGSMAAELYDFAICNVEMMIAARIPTGPRSEGVMSWFEQRLDRFMPFD